MLYTSTEPRKAEGVLGSYNSERITIGTADISRLLKYLAFFIRLVFDILGLSGGRGSGGLADGRSSGGT